MNLTMQVYCSIPHSLSMYAVIKIPAGVLVAGLAGEGGNLGVNLCLPSGIITQYSYYNLLLEEKNSVL